jgi:hypothetical protein
VAAQSLDAFLAGPAPSSAAVAAAPALAAVTAPATTTAARSADDGKAPVAAVTQLISSQTEPALGSLQCMLPPSVLPTAAINSAATAVLIERIDSHDAIDDESSDFATSSGSGRGAAGLKGRRGGRVASHAHAAPPSRAIVPAPPSVTSAADRLGGKLVALVRRIRALPSGERAVVATSWPALRGIIGAALLEQVCA